MKSQTRTQRDQTDPLRNECCPICSEKFNEQWDIWCFDPKDRTIRYHPDCWSYAMGECKIRIPGLEALVAKWRKENGIECGKVVDEKKEKG